MAFKCFFFLVKCHNCAFAVILKFIFWWNIQIRRTWCPLLPKPWLCFHSSNSHWTQPFTTNCLSPTISQYLSKCEQLFALSSSTSAILFVWPTHTNGNIRSLNIDFKTKQKTQRNSNGLPACESRHTKTLHENSTKVCLKWGYNV